MKLRMMRKNKYDHRTHAHTEHSHKKGFERVAHEVKMVIHNHPETWEAYADSPSKYWDIINMEYADAQRAYTAMKGGTGMHKDFVQELHHLAAAAMIAIEAMTCDE